MKKNHLKLMVVLSLTLAFGVVFAGENHEAEKVLTVPSLYLTKDNAPQKRHYNMRNSNSKAHFTEGGRWTVTTDQASGTWTGRGAGVKADGKLECENGSCNRVLEGTAEVNVPPGSRCEHYIAVTPDGQHAINVTFVKKSSNCSGGHSHDDDHIHGGSAHGTD